MCCDVFCGGRGNGVGLLIALYAGTLKVMLFGMSVALPRREAALTGMIGGDGDRLIGVDFQAPLPALRMRKSRFKPSTSKRGSAEDSTCAERFLSRHAGALLSLEVSVRSVFKGHFNLELHDRAF